MGIRQKINKQTKSNLHSSINQPCFVSLQQHLLSQQSVVPTLFNQENHLASANSNRLTRDYKTATSSSSPSASIASQNSTRNPTRTCTLKSNESKTRTTFTNRIFTASSLTNKAVS